MLDFYRGKRVFITGHTGFKGSWLAKILVMAGAEVYGYALSPEIIADKSTETPSEGNQDCGAYSLTSLGSKLSNSLYDIAGLDDQMHSHIGDIRDYEELKTFFDDEEPEIVFHLAAQPIVREGYKNPRYTYETNVMGTVNICECVRLGNSVKSFVNVTTDKVYENNDQVKSFKEDEKLDGYDPYSNSKSCSELVTHSYINSFLREKDIAVSTARAGNVIGGGDFAKDRIVPDLVRAAISGDDMVLRSPDSVRPYQHVLEALSAYLLLAERQYEDSSFAGVYNIGPKENDAVTTKEIASTFRDYWNDVILGNDGALELKPLTIAIRPDNGPHEASYLSLDCTKIREKLNWSPKWDVTEAVQRTVLWTYEYLKGNGVGEMEAQIREYFCS